MKIFYKTLPLIFFGLLQVSNVFGQKAQDTLLLESVMDTIMLERWKPTHGEFGGTFERMMFYRIPAPLPHSCNLPDTSHFICSKLYLDYFYKESIYDSIVELVDLTRVLVDFKVSNLIFKSISELKKPTDFSNEDLFISHVGSFFYRFEFGHGRHKYFIMQTEGAENGWNAFSQLVEQIMLATKK